MTRIIYSVEQDGSVEVEERVVLAGPVGAVFLMCAGLIGNQKHKHISPSTRHRS